MTQNAADDRLIKNEQLIRDRNVQAGRGIKKYFRNAKEIEDAPVAFICECSNLECNQFVQLSIKDYQELHKRKDRFVIYRGHIAPTVERVVASHGEFDIVQKQALAA